MKTTKKVLAVVLALVMAFGAFSMIASAAVITEVSGTENADKINVKYTVEQVESYGSYTAVDGNLYKVSVYAKAKYGINYFQVPIYYDNSKFEVFMFDSADPVTDCAVLYNGYATDMGESAIYNFELGEAWDIDGMYKADNTTVATAKPQAQFIGLGNENCVTVTPQWEAHDASSATFTAWTSGTGKDNCGIAFICLDNLGNTKNSYFNAQVVSGVASVKQDWTLMGAMYFIRSCEAADAEGAVFGAYPGGNGLEGLWDTSGAPSLRNTYAEAEPGLNIVSNAVVESAAPAVIKAAKNGEAVKTLVGWGNYDINTDTCDGLFVDDGNGAAAWNLAVEATFTAEDLAAAGLTFKNGKCEQIASLDATVKIGDGEAATKSTRFIYGSAEGTGSFSYYVVIEGIDSGADDSVTITFGGTLTEAAGGGAITGETVTLNLAEEFAAAQVRGLPEAPVAA